MNTFKMYSLNLIAKIVSIKIKTNIVQYRALHGLLRLIKTMIFMDENREPTRMYSWRVLEILLLTCKALN